jgi:hypothetical protein
MLANGSIVAVGAWGNDANGEQSGNVWIQADTWKLIDERAQGRWQGTLTSGELRFLNQKIRKLLWRDQKTQTEDAGKEIEASLLEDNLEGEWEFSNAGISQLPEEPPNHSRQV